jgi:hypothetical protein
MNFLLYSEKKEGMNKRRKCRKLRKEPKQEALVTISLLFVVIVYSRKKKRNK